MEVFPWHVGIGPNTPFPLESERKVMVVEVIDCNESFQNYQGQNKTGTCTRNKSSVNPVQKIYMGVTFCAYTHIKLVLHNSSCLNMILISCHQSNDQSTGNFTHYAMFVASKSELATIIVAVIVLFESKIDITTPLKYK